jgi:uncharacterized protein (DUF1697 family)
VALLRAINLGPHKQLAMADLRELFVQLGFADAKTLLQSGNVVFRSPKQTAAALERRLETEAAKRLHFETDFFVRTAAEWAETVARNPFPAEAKNYPGHLLLLCLKAAPDAESVDQLEAGITGREVVRAIGKALYAVYPDGVGRSRLTIGVIEKKLGTRATGRNWNTVLKLAALVGA